MAQKRLRNNSRLYPNFWFGAGCVLSALLFIVLDENRREAKKVHRGKLADTHLEAGRPRPRWRHLPALKLRTDMQTKLVKLQEIGHEYGLQINVRKTKLMRIRRAINQELEATSWRIYMDRRQKHRIESSPMENLFQGPLLYSELKEIKKISNFSWMFARSWGLFSMCALASHAESYACNICIHPNHFQLRSNCK